MSLIVISEKYLNEYIDLPELHYGRNSNKKGWYISKVKFEESINSEVLKIDFIWVSLNISLFSKTMYNFCPECYTYCNDYLYWKYGHYKLLNFIYIGKYSFLVDERYKNSPIKFKNLFYSYSLKNLPTAQMVKILYFFINIDLLPKFNGIL